MKKLGRHEEAVTDTRRKEAVMAKLIEFYIPRNHQTKTRAWTPPELRGKIIIFTPVQRKSA
jgi:hypothetical protein